MSMEAKIKKETILSHGIDTMEPTRNGRSSILMRRIKSQQVDLTKTVDSTEIDHST
jgi:hypothetical protein